LNTIRTLALQTTRRIAIAMVLLGLLGATAQADGLTVGFAIAKPPFVFAETANDTDVVNGIELDLMREALAVKGHTFVPAFMPYNRLGVDLKAGRIDAAATVRPELPGMHYSQEFVYFHNHAITRAAADIAIAESADLAGKRVVAWQGATKDLGPDFARAVENAALYEEVGNQREQVELFLKGQADVLVIDGNIFKYWARQSGEDNAAFTYHSIFGERTGFVVGFTSAKMRDDFDAGLSALKTSGRYDAIFRHYIGE